LIIFEVEKEHYMKVKKILIASWVVIVVLVSVYTLYRMTLPGSALTENISVGNGVRAVLYNGATLIPTEDGSAEFIATGKLFVSFGEEMITVQTNEAKVSGKNASFVIDASVPYTTSIIVASGVVDFVPIGKSVRLSPVVVTTGQKAMVLPSSKGVVKQNNRDVNFMSWVDFNLSFERTKLEDVVALIAATYGENVSFSSPALADCRFTAKFENSSLRAVLKEIAKQQALEFEEVEEGRWLLKGDACVN
jgi:ferric-dicitrate binding protein FerR (iron transport regulator)